MEGAEHPLVGCPLHRILEHAGEVPPCSEDGELGMAGLLLRHPRLEVEIREQHAVAHPLDVVRDHVLRTGAQLRQLLLPALFQLLLEHGVLALPLEVEGSRERLCLRLVLALDVLLRLCMGGPALAVAEHLLLHLLTALLGARLELRSLLLQHLHLLHALPLQLLFPLLEFLLHLLELLLHLCPLPLLKLFLLLLENIHPFPLLLVQLILDLLHRQPLSVGCRIQRLMPQQLPLFPRMPLLEGNNFLFVLELELLLLFFRLRLVFQGSHFTRVVCRMLGL
mmetsp:Transcript_65101/g.135707  ORF Transcript_65101/g.135707 Transcript_65101/m.135707 type:complete len:280 (-) Transcript_65101:8571-9410(-)